MSPPTRLEDPALDGPVRREWRLFLTALRHFSWVPVPAWVGKSGAQLHACLRWFPAVGSLVGAVCASVWLLCDWLTTPLVAVAMAMLAGVLMTGALHEDGLAETCDGLRSSRTREQMLDIKRDARAASRAAVGIGLVLLLRFFMLAALTGRGWPVGLGWWGDAAHGWPLIVPALIAGHAASRWMAASVMLGLPHVRLDKPIGDELVADSRSTSHLAFAALTVLPALLLLGEGVVWGAGGLLAAALARAGLVLCLRRRLGRDTAEGLGAAQQVCECAFLFGLLATARWQALL